MYACIGVKGEMVRLMVLIRSHSQQTGWEIHIPIMSSLWIMNEPQYSLRIIMLKK